MSNSYFLELPYLAAAQNQKHITMNGSLSKLDLLVQLSVLTMKQTTQPLSPVEGDNYIIGIGASGDWSGMDGQLAFYQDGAWQNMNPKQGWTCWAQDDAKLYVFEGVMWNEYAAKKSFLKPDIRICEKTAYGQDSTNAPVTGWNQRYLNLIEINQLGAGVELDLVLSRFKLPVGQYWVKIMAAAMRVGKHKVDLKNLDTSLHLIEGSCEHSEEGAVSQSALTRTLGEGELSVTDPDHYFVLMHYVEVGAADNWRFGSGGEGPSVHCKIDLWRL